MWGHSPTFGFPTRAEFAIPLPFNEPVLSTSVFRLTSLMHSHRILALVSAVAMIALHGIRSSAADLGTPEPDALKKLQGKWVTKKTNREGQEILQVIQIQKDQLLFKVIGSDGEVRLFAKGAASTTRLGPFHVLSVSNIQGGRNESDLQSVDDDRNLIYMASDDSLSLASNFEKERDDGKPTLDTYKLEPGSREAAAAAGSADSAKLAGSWKLELSLGENTRNYDLKIQQTDGKLEGTVVSARSGEHKAKTISYTDGKFSMEVDREYQGTALTLVYNGSFKDDQLSGTVAVKDHEAEYSGKWSAKRSTP